MNTRAVCLVDTCDGEARTEFIEHARVLFPFIRQILLGKQQCVDNSAVAYQLYHLLLLQVEEQLRITLKNLHS